MYLGSYTTEVDVDIDIVDVLGELSTKKLLQYIKEDRSDEYREHLDILTGDFNNSKFDLSNLSKQDWTELFQEIHNQVLKCSLGLDITEFFNLLDGDVKKYANRT